MGTELDRMRLRVRRLEEELLQAVLFLEHLAVQPDLPEWVREGSRIGVEQIEETVRR